MGAGIPCLGEGRAALQQVKVQLSDLAFIEL